MSMSDDPKMTDVAHRLFESFTDGNVIAVGVGAESLFVYMISDIATALKVSMFEGFPVEYEFVGEVKLI